MAAACCLMTASLAVGAEVVVLTSGERMDVKSYEIQQHVVVVTTWDGRHRALPIAYVDVPATEAANAHTELADRIAPERLEKARQACEAFGILGSVALYRDVLSQQVEKRRGNMSIATFDEIRAAFRNAFDDERTFDAVAAHLARNATVELLDEWNAWLHTPFARRMVAMESAVIEGPATAEAQRYYIKLSKNREAYARRAALMGRLDDARSSTKSGVEVVLYLIEAFFEAGRRIFPDEEITFDAEDLRRTLTPLMRENNVDGMIVLFRDASDDELEQYIAYWSTAEGKRIADFLNAALQAGARQGSDVAMQILTGKRQTVP
jgi:hypothetical protein